MSDKKSKRKQGPSTIAVHSSYTPSNDDGAIMPPLHLSTTFLHGNNGGSYDGAVPESEWQDAKSFKFQNDALHYDYSRTVNPTRILLEQTVAELDGNDFGLAYSSGSAALANVVALLRPGEAVLFSTDAYGGTYRYIVRAAGAQGIKYAITDLTDPVETEAALKEGGIKIIWVETPTNPLLRVTDIAQLSELAHRYGAILAVDNTFATPILQKPAELGADIVVYATSKYINGHSDVIGGVLTTSEKDLYKRLKFLQNSIGAVMSPFDSWLTLRGLRTLELRMERHVSNAREIAKFLDNHPRIKRVYYPELYEGSQGEIVKKQMKSGGGMVSIELADGSDPQKFLAALKYFPLAESLGGVESLIDHPASMTHASIPLEEREKIGLGDGLFRISVGIENVEDLLDDLRQALEAIPAPAKSSSKGKAAGSLVSTY